MEKLRLKLLDRFQCLAGECSNSCCHGGWDIEVDETTLEKWNKLGGIQNSALQESVETLANDNNKKVVFKKKPDGNCVNLTENAECQIHRDLGHEFLSVACREYPRLSLAKEDRQVVSARLSCPHVVNLLLQESNTTMFEFDDSELSDSDETVLSMSLIYKQLEKMVLRLMSMANMPLNIRVYHIAMVLSELARLNMEGRLNEKAFRKLCKTSSIGLKKQLDSISNKIRKKKLSASVQHTGSLWQVLFYNAWPKLEKDFKQKMSGSPTFELLLSWQPEADIDHQAHCSKVFNELSKARMKFSQQYGIKYRPLLQRYLEVRFINNGFPRFPYADNQIAAFLINIFPFILVNILLWMRSESETITDDVVIDTIHRLERETGHSSFTTDFLEQYEEFFHLDSYAASFLEIC